MVTTVKSKSSLSGLNNITDIIDDLRKGKMVIILDDEDRENEGDLVMASTKVSADDINFMTHYARGLICLTLTRSRCEQLRLPLMVSNNSNNLATNFTVSVEAAKGITTGISAHDRARTVRAAVAPNARPEDLRQPGHIFPVMSQPGGVLTRAGHTEAGCDLVRLAGLEPSAVIVEILNNDGTMARRDDLISFAKKYHLKIGTIADLISYRLKNEQSVEEIAELDIKTKFGKFRMVSFEDHVNRSVHLALIKGKINSSSSVMVRVHLQNTLSDVVGIEDQRLGWPLNDVMKKISKEESGVIVILRQEEEPKELIEFMSSLKKTDEGIFQEQGGTRELRQYGIGAQILRHLGVKRMRVLSSPKQMHGLSGFGLEVEEYISSR
ncbi:MAG: 3,4-dihydroxy-2-butanone-4-phosphate synthase [Gammaproteobacteria bacterium TMED78]|nr:MAG: 3,4-dihydroxy-2-butanone-4-phosphate synthase [Gammaproteobacteria bacterium TMED78]|tara:strand:- start:11401 stop:12543 length:1143 start_codon:yes stop_codon:yes gene_type:complete